MKRVFSISQYNKSPHQAVCHQITKEVKAMSDFYTLGEQRGREEGKVIHAVKQVISAGLKGKSVEDILDYVGDLFTENDINTIFELYNQNNDTQYVMDTFWTQYQARLIEE